MELHHPKSRILFSLGVGIVLGFFGVVYISGGELGIGLLLFLSAVLHILNSYWSKRVPYVRLTSDELMVFPAPLRPPRIIPRETIYELRFSKKKYRLTLANGKRLTLRVRPKQRKTFERVVKELKSEIQQRLSDAKTKKSIDESITTL